MNQDENEKLVAENAFSAAELDRDNTAAEEIAQQAVSAAADAASTQADTDYDNANDALAAATLAKTAA